MPKPPKPVSRRAALRLLAENEHLKALLRDCQPLIYARIADDALNTVHREECRTLFQAIEKATSMSGA